MRKSRTFSAVLTLFLLVPASITWAQTITTQKGLTTAIFTTSGGTVKIYLPDDIRPGDVISGSFMFEPAGNNRKQVDRNLAVLKKGHFILEGKPVKLVAMPASFHLQLPVSDRVNTSLEMVSGVDQQRSRLSVPYNLQSFDAAARPSCSLPSHVLAGSPLRITGPFDGDASNTKCSIENRSLEILAESPRQCIVSFPDEEAGIKTLQVQETGKEICTKQVSGVQMKVSPGKLDLQKGENTFIDVNITGLQQLPGTAFLTLTNETTGVVILEPSNMIVVPLLPEKVAAGLYDKRFDIRSIKSGGFLINVDLDLPENIRGMDSVPIQFDQPPLKEPRKLEDEALQTGLHQALKNIIANGGAARKEWDNVCESCQQCIEARLGSWAADLVQKLGEGILKEFAGRAVDLIGESVKAVGAAKEFFDKISDKAEKADQLAKDIEDKIRAGELQVMDFKPVFCVKSSYCLISGTIFYNPKTGCVVAIMKCEGTKLCCPDLQTKVVITYCTDERGMPRGVPGITVIKT